MPTSRRPGPVCTFYDDFFDLEDGTLARWHSPVPGALGWDGVPVCPDDTTPKVLTAEEVLQIAPGADNEATIASALNKAVTDAGITTRIGEAMLIAQCAHESGGFEGDEYVETGVESKVVFNAGAAIEAKFKAFAVQTQKMERYLQGDKVVVWRTSQAKYLKAKAAYEQANPGKKFEALTGDKQWAPQAISDYLPGDQELPYWKLWYDPSSPHAARSQMARDNGNVEAGDGLKYIGRGFIQLTWRCNYRAAGKALQLELEKHPALAAALANAIRILAWYWKSRGLNKFTDLDSLENFKQLTKKINAGLAGLADREKYYKQAKIVLGVDAG